MKAPWKLRKKDVKEQRRRARGGKMMEVHPSDLRTALARWTKSTKKGYKTVVRNNRTDYLTEDNRHLGHVIVHRRSTQAFMMGWLEQHLPKEEEKEPQAIAA